jgi:hypothetical protein
MILEAMGVPLPRKPTLKPLVHAVEERPKLSPGRKDHTDVVKDDVRKVLSGLISSVDGIAALRTHAGDAHGDGSKPKRIAPRIARLAVQASSTLGLFHIETWQWRRGRGDLDS